MIYNPNQYRHYYSQQKTFDLVRTLTNLRLHGASVFAALGAEEASSW